MKPSDNKLIRFLVAWFGLYQSIHILVNLRGLAMLSRGSIDFPAPSRPEANLPRQLSSLRGWPLPTCSAHF
jgi:hypothetical protein